MARPLRIELAGGLYHVTSRGNRRDAIYADEVDRAEWLEVFGQVCRRFNWICHGWCQMSNHYHVIVETVEGNLAHGMRQLNGVYTQSVNRRHRRVGHVFQGRYKAIHVERDSYLLELARYVVLNPVRAGMVGDAGDWRWSSYAAMVGREPPPDWLQTDWILGQFGAERQLAIARYMDFVRAGIGLPGVWEKVRGQVYLGSDAFVERMSAESGKDLIGEIPRAQRRPLARPLADFFAQSANRGTAMAEAFATGRYTLKEIADVFGVHYATVSRAVTRHAAES